MKSGAVGVALAVILLALGGCTIPAPLPASMLRSRIMDAWQKMAEVYAAPDPVCADPAYAPGLRLSLEAARSGRLEERAHRIYPDVPVGSYNPESPVASLCPAMLRPDGSQAYRREADKAKERAEELKLANDRLEGLLDRVI